VQSFTSIKLKTWIQPLPDPDIKQKNPRGHEYQTSEIITLCCLIWFHFNWLQSKMDNPASTDTLTGNIGHTGRRQQTITQKNFPNEHF
jgi:hypothetical protein